MGAYYTITTKQHTMIPRTYFMGITLHFVYSVWILWKPCWCRWPKELHFCLVTTIPLTILHGFKPKCIWLYWQNFCHWLHPICQIDNFWSNQWRKFRQNDGINLFSVTFLVTGEEYVVVCTYFGKLCGAHIFWYVLWNVKHVSLD